MIWSNLPQRLLPFLSDLGIAEVYLFAFSFPQQCCDLGYHASLNRALRTFLSAELNLEQSKHEGLDAIENAVENLDATSDKQRLMEMYNNVFCPPMKFEFQPHMGDMVRPFPILYLSLTGLECTRCMYSFYYIYITSKGEGLPFR